MAPAIENHRARLAGSSVSLLPASSPATARPPEVPRAPRLAIRECTVIARIERQLTTIDPCDVRGHRVLRRAEHDQRQARYAIVRWRTPDIIKRVGLQCSAHAHHEHLSAKIQALIRCDVVRYRKEESLVVHSILNLAERIADTPSLFEAVAQNKRVRMQAFPLAVSRYERRKGLHGRPRKLADQRGTAGLMPVGPGFVVVHHQVMVIEGGRVAEQQRAACNTPIEYDSRAA